MNLEAARCFGQKGKAHLFLKKKKQKDFAPGVPGARAAPEPNERKLFASFFQERTCFLPAMLQEIGDGRSTIHFSCCAGV